jgi:ATP-binding cassette subfamily C protein
VLPVSDRTKLIAAGILQVSLGFVDLIAVAAIGFLGALSISGIQSSQPDDQSLKILSLLGLDGRSFQTQVAILGIVCSILLIARTLISIVATRKLFFFLSRRGASITSTLISKLFSKSLIEIHSRPNQEFVYAATIGVSSIVLGIIGSTFSLIADYALLLILLVGLFLVDPLIAVSSILFFGFLSAILYFSMNRKIHKLAIQNTQFSITTNEKILEALNSFREIVVSGRRAYFGNQIGKLRFRHADVLAEMQFLPNVGKYIIESSVVIGAVFIAGVQFWLQDARDAFATLAVFLAAGTRIAPAVLRIQQNSIQLRNAIASALPTLKLIESLDDAIVANMPSGSFHPLHVGFIPVVTLDSVSFRFAGNDKPTLNRISISIGQGSLVALVGPTGSGKTTLVDVMLGVLPAQTGVVKISGESPLTTFAAWPGAVAYVPQNVVIGSGTIRQNVIFGFTEIVDSETRVWESLEVANLAEQVRFLPQGIDTLIGDGGMQLSGGQRQRLGIARALFTKPKLLVLDEATSALDGQTEEAISRAIQRLKGTVTVIVIAHRLATVREADHVIYLDQGNILAEGTFESVRCLVRDFDEQAKLMGL